MTPPIDESHEDLTEGLFAIARALDKIASALGGIEGALGGEIGKALLHLSEQVGNVSDSVRDLGSEL